MIELWEDVEGYEGKYQVSTTGKAKSLNYNNTGKEKLLKPKINKQGYLEVKLSKNNKAKDYMLSRLVLETFLKIKLTKNDIIMYEDNDSLNPSLDNLYIITRGQRQELTYDKDKRYRPKYEYYGEKLSTKEIAKRTGIDARTIRERIRSLYWNIYEAAEIPKVKLKGDGKI